MNNLNNNLNELSPANLDSLNNVDVIVVTGNVQRSATIESLHTFVASAGEIFSSSIAKISSDIVHEGSHIKIYEQNNQDVNKSRGADVERALTEEQIVVIGHLNPSNYDVLGLYGYLFDPTAIENRLQLDPFASPGAGVLPFIGPAAYVSASYTDYSTFSQNYVEQYNIGGGGNPLP